MIPIIKFVTGIHDEEAIKNMLLNIILSFFVLNQIIIFVVIPYSFKTIKKIVERSESSLNIIKDKLEKYGIKTTIENIKEARVSKPVTMTDEEIRETPIYDRKLLKTSKENIKIETIEGKIETLKQYRLKVINYLNEPETIEYLYLDDEINQESEHTRKLTN